ncbi:MAG: hypothetical protein LBF68_00955 [Christensenellaceae bacterium]|jgi:stage IV sporulation protein FB|nr:hypothetical protein [Christensenellaceae bacterium]
MHAKIKIDPLFLLMIAITIYERDYIYLICTLIGSLIHEFAHAFVAYKRGYVLKELKVNPFGASLNGLDKIHKDDRFYVIIAGPLVNIFISMIIIVIWWYYPNTYNNLYPFYHTNLMLAFFNLLPAYPLDGGNLLLSLTTNTLQTIKMLRVFGLAIAFLLFSSYIMSIFGSQNQNLLLMSALLFSCALNKTEMDTFEHISAIHTRDYVNYPIEIRCFRASYELSLIKLLKRINPHYVSEFHIIDNKNNVIARLDEQTVLSYCFKYGTNAQIKNVNTIYNINIKQLEIMHDDIK